MKIHLLAVSIKHGGLCVAGVNTDTNEFVRLVTDDGNGSGPIDIKQFPFKPLDIIEANIFGKAPNNGAQTENYFIADYNMKLLGSDNRVETLNNYVDTKHITPFGTRYASIKDDLYDNLNNSICLLKVSNMVLYNVQNQNGDFKPKISFDTTMSNGVVINHERFSITEQRFYKMMKERNANDVVSIGDGYLLISLGIKDTHYSYNQKYVSGIFVLEDLS